MPGWERHQRDNGDDFQYLYLQFVFHSQKHVIGFINKQECFSPLESTVRVPLALCAICTGKIVRRACLVLGNVPIFYFWQENTLIPVRSS